LTYWGSNYDSSAVQLVACHYTDWAICAQNDLKNKSINQQGLRETETAKAKLQCA
jgi:hypothetical protein